MFRIYALIFLFLIVMVTVTTVAYRRTSGSTGVDPSLIAEMRK